MQNSFWMNLNMELNMNYMGSLKFCIVPPFYTNNSKSKVFIILIKVQILKCNSIIRIVST